MTKRIGLIIIPAVLFLMFQGCGASNGSAVKAVKGPWSGYWWPFDERKGTHLFDKGGPLEKYDKYTKMRTGKKPGAKDWEKKYHDGETPPWYGHCHAWASAAIMEDEPVKPVRKLGITFNVGDLKGILAVCHYDDPVDFFVGYRYKQDGIPRDDVLPAMDFHNTLIEWLGIEKIEQSVMDPSFNVMGAKKEPIIMDKTNRPEVWNYPLINFSMKCTRDPDDKEKIHVACTTFYLDNSVNVNFVGQKVLKSTFYYFIIGDFHEPSDGGWEKNSLHEHPGFLWHPSYQVSGNPNVKYHIVREIMHGAAN